MKALRNVPIALLAICSGLELVIAATMVAALDGAGSGLLFLISQGGTALVLLSTIAYITFWDSKKRWVDVSWQVRMSRALTFYRN